MKKLPPVKQIQIDPFYQLSPDLRRRACSILNELRRPVSEPLSIYSPDYPALRAALAAKRVQGLLTRRDYRLMGPPRENCLG